MVTFMAAKLGWGVAGTGWVARDYVIPAILASSNGALLALHDADPAALARAAALAPDAAAAASLAAFLATPGLQAVYVATPNDAHRPLVEAAARAGLAVLCEKPMAATAGDAAAMVAACAAAEVRYATAFDQRFHPAHACLAKLIAGGRLGRVTAIRVVYACWVPPEWAADNWRVARFRAGGGALIDLAPHGLDLAAMLLGQEIVAVSAMGQALVQDYADSTVEDGAMLLARTSGGALLQLHVAYNCPETLPRRRLEVVGTLAQAVALDTMGQVAGGRLTLIDAGDGTARDIVVPDAGRSPFLGQIEAFSYALLHDRAFRFSAEADLRLMRLVEQASAMAQPHAQLAGVA